VENTNVKTTGTEVRPFGLAEARDAAGKFAREVRTRFGDKVRAVRLFGSAARGDWTPESDIDVLVLLDGSSGDDADQVSRLAFHLGSVEAGIPLRALVMSEGQFRHLGARERRLALDIQAEGMDL
jgi:hypothetical protein